MVLPVRLVDDMCCLSLRVGMFIDKHIGCMCTVCGIACGISEKELNKTYYYFQPFDQQVTAIIR